MKKLITISILAWACLGVIAGSSHARDMRQAAIEARNQLNQAKQQLKSVTADIREDKAALTREIKALSALPKKSIQKSLENYMDGQSAFTLIFLAAAPYAISPIGRPLKTRSKREVCWSGPSWPWGCLPCSSVSNEAFS